MSFNHLLLNNGGKHIRFHLLSDCLKICGIMFFAVMLSTAGAQSNEANTIIFGVTPWASGKIMKKMYAPLIQYLSDALNLETHFVVAKTYEALGERIHARQVDIGFFSPNAYVEAKEKYPNLKYILTVQKIDKTNRMRDHYKGVIISLKDSPYMTLKDLKGCRFAFTDFSSASGYIYPMALLKKKGVQPETYFSKIMMLKKHDRITSALTIHTIDAGATWDGNLAVAESLYGSIFKVILKTAPIPFDACTAGSHVPEKRIAAIKNALLKISPNERVYKLLQESRFPYNGFKQRDNAFYDVVREVRSKLD